MLDKDVKRPLAASSDRDSSSQIATISTHLTVVRASNRTRLRSPGLSSIGLEGGLVLMQYAIFLTNLVSRFHLIYSRVDLSSHEYNWESQTAL